MTMATGVEGIGSTQYGRLALRPTDGQRSTVKVSKSSSSVRTWVSQLRSSVRLLLITSTNSSHDGHPHELNYVSTQLQQRYPQRVIAYLATSFDGKTNIGVDKIGHLVAREVRPFHCMTSESLAYHLT
jgi:hypothetical protein